MGACESTLSSDQLAEAPVSITPDCKTKPTAAGSLPRTNHSGHNPFIIPRRLHLEETTPANDSPMPALIPRRLYLEETTPANDSPMPAHRVFELLEHRSQNAAEKFLEGKLQRDLKAVPGVGKSTVEKLAVLDIFTTDQLAGLFMSLDRDCDKMVSWLKQHKLCAGGHEATCTRALAEKLHLLLDQNQENDAGVPAAHMKFSQLPIRSAIKHIEFLDGPLQRECADVPGVADVTVSRLAALDVHTVDQLAGRFMQLDRDPALMVEWLNQNKLCGGGFAKTCTRALAEKLNRMLD